MKNVNFFRAIRIQNTHAPPDLGKITFQKVSRIVQVGIEYTYIQLHKYTQRRPGNTLQPDRPQHDRPAACVIAQQ